MCKEKKGFTLVEMLIVIAIIAILVAILIPTVSSAVKKAEAAADAANLRAVLGQLNTETLQDRSLEDLVKKMYAPESRSVPGAEIFILYSHPGFIEAYYVKDQTYYGIPYFSEVAEKAISNVSTAQPVTAGTWYPVGQT